MGKIAGSDTRADAFNHGSQARVDGVPYADGEHIGDPVERYWWRQGWMDVHRCWGTRARRWTVKKLPRVDAT